MFKVVGYGEDALTLWMLKKNISALLNRFHDTTSPSDCLAFYRPSFGRRSRKGSSVFGEFDAIVASKKNVYLIESKWDNLRKSNKKKPALRKEQELRHRILSWYLTHWNRRYLGHWEDFARRYENEFKFNGKTIPKKKSILAKNLEFILAELLERCQTISHCNIKNVLIFFHNNGEHEKPRKINRIFDLISIDYGKAVKDNYVVLFEEQICALKKESKQEKIGNP